MRLLYTISLYKLPEQFGWLWKTIYNPHDAFILHVDRKTPPPVYQKFREIVGEVGNVYWQKQRSVVWMGPGLVEVELEAIWIGLEKFKDFGYLVNLSGQDLQIRPREEIVEELRTGKDTNYVSMEPLSDLPFHIRRRPYLLTFQYGDRLLKTPLSRPVPRGLTIAWKGSWWHILSHAFCDWLVRSEKGEAYRRFLQNVQAPDELYFQNVLMDSPFNTTAGDRNRTFVKWSGTGGSPDTLTTREEDELIRGKMFFARKFDHNVDEEIQRRIANRVTGFVDAHDNGVMV